MKTAALVIGVLLLLAGAATFIPGVVADGMMFGSIPVSTPLAIAFIVTGLVGLMIGLSRTRELAPPRADGSRDLRDM
jgi:hypothetical protein